MRHITPKWDLTPSDAIDLQKRLSGDVIRKSRLTTVETVAGIDTGYSKGMAKAAVVSLKYPSFEPLEQAISLRPVNFPYIPGLLSFREGPLALEEDREGVGVPVGRDEIEVAVAVQVPQGNARRTAPLALRWLEPRRVRP